MADEIPISDVLCEAMEYLSKLGLNLRTRSESLKEKKINKYKLKNAHAVRKAANKVLLICELSKKSLENVETGVKNVLSVVSKQSSVVGGKSSSPVKKNFEDKNSYKIFQSGSHKIKIPQKVPLKHFLSVKVRALNMTMSMQKKYPVYYDCKLYRLRRKIEKKKLSKDSNTLLSNDSLLNENSNKEKQESSSSLNELENQLEHSSHSISEESDDYASHKNQHNEDETSDKTTSKSNKGTQESSSSFNELENQLKHSSNNINEESDDDVSHKKQHNDNETGDKTTSNSNKGRQESSSSFNELENELKHSSNNINEESDDDVSHKKQHNDNETGDKTTSNSDKGRQESSSSFNELENELKHSSNNISAESVDHDLHSRQHNVNETSDKKTSKKKLKEHNRDSKNSISSAKSPQETTKSTKQKSPELDESKIGDLLSVSSKVDKPKKLNVLDDDNKNSVEIAKNIVSLENEPNNLNTEIVISDNENEDVSFNKENKKKSVEMENCIENVDNSEKLLKEDTSSSTEQQSDKPLIKCVSISKLLKPDVLLKNEKIKPMLNLNTFSKISTSKHVSKLERKQKKEEEYLKRIRKEVSSFKPKKVEVNITRLPKLTERFLKSLDLKKVTHNGTIVIQVSDPLHSLSTKNIEISGNSSKGKEGNLEPSIIDKVKNDLLNDSDSEKNMNLDTDAVSLRNTNKETCVEFSKSADLQEAKQMLLYDTDSDIEKNTSNDETVDTIIINKEANNVSLENKVVDSEDQQSTNIEKAVTDTEQEKIKSSLLNDSSDNNSSSSKHSLKRKILHKKHSKHKYDKTLAAKRKLMSSSSDSDTSTTKLKSTLDKIESSLTKNDSSSDGELFQCKKKMRIRNIYTSSDSEVEAGVKKNIHSKSSGQHEKNNSDGDEHTKNNSDVDEHTKNNSDVDEHSKNNSDVDEHSKNNSDVNVHSKNNSDVDEHSKNNSDVNVHSKNNSDVDEHSKNNSDVNVHSKNNSDVDEHTKNNSDINVHSKNNSDVDEHSKNNSDIDEHSMEKMSDSRKHLTSSCNTNSETMDASDKDSDSDHIDRLANLKSLQKTTRRRGPASERSRKNKRNIRKMPKVEAIGEQLLQAESNSDGASEADSEVEDLPSVTIPAINGDFVHLAKEDLLEESDSSNEVAEVEVTTEEVIEEEDSDTEENLKLKRRKANAISSDSDAGSSRKKDEHVNDNDSDNSEDEDSEPKRSKRKKKVSDSDGSAASSAEGRKKKRRRIKQVKDSDASGSDTENEGKNKHGRKNIRKVMGKDQLEEATKKAAREEKERIARITERQKMYNNMLFDESGKLDEVVLDKVVLDFDPETKEPIIEVDRGLVKKLKPHQANGIKFMWDACFESVKRIKKDRGSGCILAHCMGLGKTLQVVTLTHTLLTHGELTGVNRVLVVCPLSTVLNWVNEFHMWLEYSEKDYEVDVYELSRYKQNSERAYQLQQWFEHGGVCVLGYEMFRNLSAEKTKKFKKKMLKVFQESLVNPGPDMVVCDEGHLLKNEKTSLSQSMNRIKSRRRIVLTGTPLQNNLKEYYCMVQFVKPNLLGKYNEYLNRFVNPITNGQYTDSTEYDIKVMKRRSHVLHKMLDGAVQRRDYGVLAPFLPPKHEYVLFITLTEIQIKLYEHYLENYSRRPLPGKSSGFLFPDFQSLQRIWTHPLVLQYNSARYEKKQQKKREREEEDSEGSIADFIDDDSTSEDSTSEESLDDNSDFSDDSGKKSKKKSSKKNKAKDGKASGRRGTRANPGLVELEDEDKIGSDVEEVKNDNPTEWWIKLVMQEELEDLRNSHKLVLLFDILKQCEIIGDKLLVFSQSIYSLDLIEHFLSKVDEATQDGRLDDKLGGHVGSWSPGIDYFRLDGSTSCENRSIWCKNFNKEDNPRARLFLISTRAGGLGINLVAANRVVIFDVSWNPSHDVQSIFRVYRFGQKKPCYVYRFLAMGTMEEKIYERQVTKQAISKRVIDEQQIDRHYAENDLAELYQFAPRPPQPRPLPALPKDRLFAEMLMEHENQVYKFHEHDSLLENKEEETLSEEERKAAWEDFENEKNKPPPPPFPSPWPHAGMATAMQQQQLTVAAMVAMLRKDMPNINENQIRDMLPLIYNANPGLMQKMSEIYKYAQPGMMNMNSMMGSIMNPGAAGTGGMGGTSGLQYEPPWQRQQHQQQQMRLQQMLQQQQNQMNAKYYAGGLGSRDPVAMALQQQRAREMMLGERARSRGRPPLQPRAPPTAGLPPLAQSQDVVNLADSD